MLGLRHSVSRTVTHGSHLPHNACSWTRLYVLQCFKELPEDPTLVPRLDRSPSRPAGSVTEEADEVWFHLRMRECM